jgi:hypothetical protein
MDQDRRASIRTILAAGGLTLAGCLGGTTDPNTEAPDQTATPTTSQQESSRTSSPTETVTLPGITQTYTPGDCTASPPRPDESDVAVQPSTYPTVPTTVTVEQSKQFVRQFDRAYQRNNYIAQSNPSNGEIKSVNINNHGVVRTVEMENGVVVGVNGWLVGAEILIETTDGGETRVGELEADDWYGAWYHVLPHRLNYFDPSHQIEGDDEIPGLEQFWTVYCARTT